MVEWHNKSKRLPTGGRRTTIRKSTKKNSWRGGIAANTATGKEERVTTKNMGNTQKVRATSTKYANVLDNSTKKTIKVEIIGVTENNANRLFARANTITKGAKIKIKVGSEEKIAVVKSRPGQDGIVNAIIE
jgi:small subunit ribosomal protein S8e